MKTVSFEEQIMSKDKYTGIFSRQMEAIVFIILQIFYNTHEKIFTNSLLFSARNMYIFKFSLVRLCEETNVSLLL